MIDLTTVAQAALVLFGAVITTVIVPCVKKNTTVQQQNSFTRVLTVARKRKPMFLDWLNKQGITIDADKLDAMIEAAVHEIQ